MARVRLRTALGRDVERPEEDATPAAIRAALYLPELWYGTDFALQPSDPNAPRLSTVSVSNAYIAPDEPGDFLLSLEDGGVFYSAEQEPRFTREQIRAYFERYAVGDSTWLDDFTWVEVVGGQVTGRHRGRAV
jgi:hypothetical protein